MARSESNTLVNGLIGAVVTIVFSFTIFSPILGGAVAGYLEKTDGLRVGAISGAIAIIPIFLFGIVFFGLFAVFGLPAALGLLFLPLLLVFGIIWIVGLSALGGYLGVYLRDEFR